MNTAAKPMYEWKTLPWKQFHRCVSKLQTRIYRASQRGDVRTVHRLQRLLMKSWSFKCLAVRQVAQVNRGKRTAGVDGIKNLTESQRMRMAQSLTLRPPTVKPVRRVWIPKPGKPEKRPLGIPVMRGRAEQTLARYALEPEWEARFEPNSYGFRLGRSCHDAIAAIFSAISLRAKFVLEADITGCFDNISPVRLLDKLRTFPSLRRVIKRWLHAGIMEEQRFIPTDKGTPQGGAISPLLANIALHGLENHLRASFPNRRSKPFVVVYADDFVVMHDDLAVIEGCQRLTSQWLAGMGLELKPSKTRITHTLHEHHGNVGFDFLGFTARQFPVGKYHSGRRPNGQPLGFKTIIRPSKTAQKRHLAELASVIRRHRTMRQDDLIRLLNPKIRGWANYYATVVSKQVFRKMDNGVYQQLRRWARRRHPKKNATWVARRYWHTRQNRHWNFEDGEAVLAQHADTPIRRHVKVQGTRSPHDGDFAYWGTRMSRHPELSRTRLRLLRDQHGRCAVCRRYFTDMGEITVHDLVGSVRPKSQAGRRQMRRLVHGHCRP